MTLADVGYISRISGNAFYNCNKLATLILRVGSVVTLDAVFAADNNGIGKTSVI